MADKKSGASNGAKDIKPFDEQNTNDAAGQRKPYHYRSQFPKAGRRTNEGQRQMKERIKLGDMHLHYGFEDTPEGKKKYQEAKKKYDLY